MIVKAVETEKHDTDSRWKSKDPCKSMNLVSTHLIENRDRIQGEARNPCRHEWHLHENSCQRLYMELNIDSRASAKASGFSFPSTKVLTPSC